MLLALAAVESHCWAGVPLQSHSCKGVLASVAL